MFSRTALYVVLHRRHLNNARSDRSTKLGTFVVASPSDCSFYSCSLCTITRPTEGTHHEALLMDSAACVRVWPDQIVPNVNSIAFGSAPRREVDSQPIKQLDRPAVSQTETHTLGFLSSLSVADTAISSRVYFGFFVFFVSSRHSNKQSGAQGVSGLAAVEW